MPLRTYLGQTIIEDIVLVDVDSQYVPGSRVVNRAWSSHRPVPSPGLIITAEYEENCPVFPSSITVLWPDVPAAIDFSSMIMPIVRQTFKPLRANPLVGIQPMSQPRGLIFYIDHLSGSSSGSTK